MRFSLCVVLVAILSSALPFVESSQNYDLSCYASDEFVEMSGSEACMQYQVEIDRLMRDFMCPDDDTESEKAIKDLFDSLKEIRKDRAKAEKDRLKDLEKLEKKMREEQEKLEKELAKQEKKKAEEAKKKAKKEAEAAKKLAKEEEKAAKKALEEAEKAEKDAIKEADKDAEEAAKAAKKAAEDATKAAEDAVKAAEDLVKKASVKAELAAIEAKEEAEALADRQQELEELANELQEEREELLEALGYSEDSDDSKDSGDSDDSGDRLRRSLRPRKLRSYYCKNLCFGWSPGYCELQYPWCEGYRNRELSDFLPSFMKTEYVIDEEQMFGNPGRRGLDDDYDEEESCRERVKTLKFKLKALSYDIEEASPVCADMLSWDHVKCHCTFSKCG